MLTIAAGMAKRAVPVDLILVKAEGEYLDQVPPDVRVIDLNSRRTATSLPKLIRYLRRERPVALLSTLDETNAAALVAKFAFRGRLRLVVRQSTTLSEAARIEGFKVRLVSRAFKMLVRATDRVVAVSQGVADDLRAQIPAASHKITVIHNPVVTPDLTDKAALSVSHPWFNDAAVPVILSAGRLGLEKDYATLLRAFAEVTRSRPARLVILGEGAERQNLLDLAESLGISRCFDLPGFDVNPFAYMAKANVFVLSSKYEGFPNVLAQAMACGAPVVSADCRSGPREILQDGKYGLLVPVGDWRQMAKAILDTLDNPIPADRLISRASIYSADAAVDRYLEVLLGSEI